MEIGLDLRLEERLSDRVFVHLALSPHGEHVQVEGAAVQLVGPDGAAICPRQLVPISGMLTGPMMSLVELRWMAPELPNGAQVEATVWSGSDCLRQRCPTTPGTCLRGHLLGGVLAPPDPDDVLLEVPTAEERAKAEAHLPWLKTVRVAGDVHVIEMDEGPSVDDIQASVGCGAKAAELLKDLLGE